MSDYIPIEMPNVDPRSPGSFNIQSQDPTQEYLQELGFPPAAPDAPGDLPPGMGAGLVPHYVTFSAIMNYMTRTYRWTYDAARKHSDQNATAIRNDTNIM